VTQVSLEDLEGAATSVLGFVGSTGSLVLHTWQSNQAACLAAGGAIGLIYGGPFAFTFLFARALTASGLPPVKAAFLRLHAAYGKAKALPARETESRTRRVQSLQDELKAVQAECERVEKQLAAARYSVSKLHGQLANNHQSSFDVPSITTSRCISLEAHRTVLLDRMRDLQVELSSVPPSRRAAPVLAAAIINDPFAPRDLFLAVCAATSAALSAATANAARALSLGASVGERISGLVDCVIGQTKMLAHRLTKGGSAECAALGQLAPTIAERLVIWLAGRAIGCWMALRLQSLSMQLHVALLSSQALVAGINAMPQRVRGSGAGSSDDSQSPSGDTTSHALVPRRAAWAPRREAVVWAIAIIGLHIGATSSPPLPIRLLLLPVYICEAALRAMAAHSTKGELTEALEKRKLR